MNPDAIQFPDNIDVEQIKMDLASRKRSLENQKHQIALKVSEIQFYVMKCSIVLFYFPISIRCVKFSLYYVLTFYGFMLFIVYFNAGHVLVINLNFPYT